MRTNFLVKKSHLKKLFGRGTTFETRIERKCYRKLSFYMRCGLSCSHRAVTEYFSKLNLVHDITFPFRLSGTFNNTTLPTSGPPTGIYNYVCQLEIHYLRISLSQACCFPFHLPGFNSLDNTRQR